MVREVFPEEEKIKNGQRLPRLTHTQRVARVYILLYTQHFHHAPRGCPFDGTNTPYVTFKYPNAKYGKRQFDSVSLIPK